MRFSIVFPIVTALAFVLCLAVLPATVRAAPPASEPTLSISQMVEQAQEKLGALRQALTESFDELAQARESQDVQRIGRVNEALLAVKGLMRLAEQNWVALQEAKASGDQETAEHEYVKLSLAATKVRELVAQLKALAGPEISREADGHADVEVRSDKNLPSQSLADPFGWYYLLFRSLSDPFGADPTIRALGGDGGTSSSTTPATASPFY